jgi:hypothetical protein
VSSFLDWVDWAEPIAYGPLGLKPWEFERLQPGEFLGLWDGYRWRQEQQENMAAFFVCQLMNISGKSLKRAITPKELLKPLRGPERRHKQDEAYLKQQFRRALGGDTHSHNR